MAETITGVRYEIGEIPQALQELLTEFQRASFDARQEAVQAGAEVLKKALEEASPRATGTFAKSWIIKEKTKGGKPIRDRRYVGNTKTVKSKRNGKERDVPLSTILEKSDKSPHKGLMRQTFDRVEPQIFDAIKNKLKNGGNKQ